MSEGLDEEGEALVFATDRMITSMLLGQFEHNIEKYRRLTPTTVAMVSGELNNYQKIFDNLKIEDSYDTIEQKIYDNIIKERDGMIEKEIFSRFKIDQDYIKNVLSDNMPNKIIDGMLNDIKNFEFQVSVLLAGFKGGHAYISDIKERSISYRRDISFSAIGSGSIQAINTLFFQKHSKNEGIKTTLYNVYKAKRNSEVAIGVGKETDLFILSNTGNLYKVEQENISKLSEIYESEMKYGKESKHLNDIIESLKKNKNQ